LWHKRIQNNTIKMKNENNWRHP